MPGRKRRGNNGNGKISRKTPYNPETETHLYRKRHNETVSTLHKTHNKLNELWGSVSYSIVVNEFLGTVVYVAPPASKKKREIPQNLCAQIIERLEPALAEFCYSKLKKTQVHTISFENMDILFKKFRLNEDLPGKYFELGHIAKQLLSKCAPLPSFLFDVSSKITNLKCGMELKNNVNYTSRDLSLFTVMSSLIFNLPDINMGTFEAIISPAQKQMFTLYKINLNGNTYYCDPDYFLSDEIPNNLILDDDSESANDDSERDNDDSDSSLVSNHVQIQDPTFFDGNESDLSLHTIDYGRDDHFTDIENEGQPLETELKRNISHENEENEEKESDISLHTIDYGRDDHFTDIENEGQPQETELKRNISHDKGNQNSSVSTIQQEVFHGYVTRRRVKLGAKLEVLNA